MSSKALPWKRISSKTILDHPSMKITDDKVELPNGKTKSYVRFAAGHRNSVAIIAINNDNKILLQREYSYPPNKVMWQLPGGAVNKAEDILLAANRELAEESGYQAKTMKQIGSFYINNRRSDQQQFILLATDLYEYSLPEDDDEFIETYWLSREELESKLTNGEFDNINLLAALNLWFHQDSKKA